MNHRGRVLFVDDELDFTEIVKWQLEKRSFIVDTANSGESALEKLLVKEVDVLVADIRMPGMNGIELISRTLEINPDIRCVVITGHGDIDTAIQAMRAGAVNYIKKPASVDELDMAISKAMEALCLIREARTNHIELENNYRELKKLRAQLEALLTDEQIQRKAAETALKNRVIRENLVELLGLSLRLWKQSTGKTKIDFAEATKIWSASVDQNGTYRTRTLDKYLKLSSLPPNPRHSDVLDTAYFVLKNCPLETDMRHKLEQKTAELEILMTMETFPSAAL